MSREFHLAGIIPLAHQPLDLNMPWHDSLIPIGQNYLAVERAVAECASVGCETIWIVLPKGMQPLIRQRLGDIIEDPMYANVSPRFAKFPRTLRKTRTIYYVNYDPKDLGLKESFPWSVIHGADVAHKVCLKISKWVCPKKFYVAFPYGIYPVTHGEWRRQISSGDNFSWVADPIELGENVDILDDEYLGFTFGPDDLIRLKKAFRKLATGVFDPNAPKSTWKDGKFPQKKLPVEQRYSGRWLKMSDVLKEADWISKNSIRTEWYFNIDNWQGLREWLSSFHADDFKRPWFMRHHILGPVGKDEVE